MRNELLIDLLALAGLALMAAGVWLAFGWPATAMFAGGVLLSVALLMAFAPARPRGDA